MKKIKFGASFFALIAITILTKRSVILLNYFLALALHEFAHLLVALKRGYNLRFIKVDLLGVSIELETDISSKDAFAINIAGPVANMFACFVCLILYIVKPESFVALSAFFVANFVLSLFNLLPIYPLDGGKIFCGLIKNNKLYLRLDAFFRLLGFCVFGSLFIWSSLHVINWFYFVMAIFFILAKPNNKTTLSIFNNKQKKLNGVELLCVNDNCSLYNLMQKISKNKYTIFYFNAVSPVYLSEESLIKLTLKHPLSTKVGGLILNK